MLSGQDGDRGGYLRSQELKADGRFPASDPDDHWWIPSGRSFYTPIPPTTPSPSLRRRGSTSSWRAATATPFGQDTFVDFDANDLLMTETRDALGNRVTVEANDYRVLQPRLVSDPNRNQTEVAFDTLGMVVGTAVMGKPLPAPAEGDTLTGFASRPHAGRARQLLRRRRSARRRACRCCAHATTRIVYDLDRFRRTRQANPQRPDEVAAACAATLARETHVSSPLPPQGLQDPAQLHATPTASAARSRGRSRPNPEPLDVA